MLFDDMVCFSLFVNCSPLLSITPLCKSDISKCIELILFYIIIFRSVAAEKQIILFIKIS